MNQDFLNMIRMHASIVGNSKTLTDIGQIMGYDPTNQLVTVMIYPQDGDTPALQTGWIPIFTAWAGNGWGLFAAPSIGDIVEVHYQQGSLQNAYVGLRTFNINQRPLPVPSGEFWLVHKSGAFIKLTNDDKLSINSDKDLNITTNVGHGGNVNITADAKVNITGTTEVDVMAPIIKLLSPDVQIGNGALSALLTAAAAAVYNTHTHTDPQGGITGTPLPQMTADVTVNTTAS